MKYSKYQAAVMSLIVLGAVLYPVTENWAEKPKDSFPFSYYPMFSKKKDKVYGLSYVVGYDTTGIKKNIPYRLIGTGGFNQVRRQIRKAVKKEAGVPFLRRVANRIHKKDKKLHAELSRIELVKGYYNLENYFLEKNSLPVLERSIQSLNMESL